ncbi:MAG: outer membrane lipoprotein carrier protein LolA, partial [Bacteroidetes bacterium]|nr:outer membrane lipoprotein carrier protein LolA [Bacteroidota bacterium]
MIYPIPKLLRVVLLVCGYFVSVPLCTMAQAPSPMSLLEELVVRYQTTMEASFVHQLTSELWDESQIFTGQVQLWGDRYRIETLSEIIIGRGEEAWIYRPEENQVLITTIEGEGLAYSPGALFHSYEELYYPHTSTYEILDGIPHFRLELIPVQENFSISSLTLWIRETDHVITRIVAVDQNSMRTELDLKEIQTGIPI